MSYGVMYCLFISGERFNSTLPKGSAADAAELKALRLHPTEFEFTWPEMHQSVAAQLTGDITLLWTDWRYSALVREDKRVIDEVAAWEQALKARFHRTKIYRLDEMLYDEFDASHGAAWYRDAGLIAKFEQWLRAREPLHWAVISDPDHTPK
jgi:hypothetical protein